MGSRVTWIQGSKSILASHQEEEYRDYRVHGAIECASSRAPLPSLIRHFACLQGYDLRQSTSTQLIPPSRRIGLGADRISPAQPCRCCDTLQATAGGRYMSGTTTATTTSTTTITTTTTTTIATTITAETQWVPHGIRPYYMVYRYSKQNSVRPTKGNCSTLCICNHRRLSGRLPCPGWSRSARPGTDLVWSQLSRVCYHIIFIITFSSSIIDIIKWRKPNILTQPRPSKQLSKLSTILKLN